MREQASEKLRNSGAIWLGSRKAWTKTGFRPHRTAEGLDRLGHRVREAVARHVARSQPLVEHPFARIPAVAPNVLYGLWRTSGLRRPFGI
jgi:hypothetical protein